MNETITAKVGAEYESSSAVSAKVDCSELENIPGFAYINRLNSQC